jgi:hypothetical protein
MVDGAGAALVLRRGDGRSIDLGNFEMSLKATGDDTAGAFGPKRARASYRFCMTSDGHAP